VNKWWITDEVRYGWKFVHSEDRLREPSVLLNVEDAVEPRGTVDWAEAYAGTLEGLRREMEGGRLGLVVSPMLSCEEAYLLGRLALSLDPQAVLAVGPVPRLGEDKTFPGGYTIYAEKAPNARGVRRALEAVAGSADRVLGNLANVMAQWDLAEKHYEAALVLDRKSGFGVWLTHSQYDYAVMLQRRAQPGDAGRARELLAQALAESSALGLVALTPRIQALAETIAHPPPAYPCGLSEREVEVLRLLAMGRNNREIGQVLAISPNTVANHVRSILEKTYTANRTEAAAFANREGLLKA